MQSALKRCLTLITVGAMLAGGAGCSNFQSTKNVWKGTKGLWYEYVSSPASIDYDAKGTLSAQGQALVDGMMGVDVELNKLERLMSNADRPPTRGWLNGFFSEVPWVDGFTGVRADGTLLGTEVPAGKTAIALDYNRLLYEPGKQSSRALRGDWQMSPEGPVVMLAAPLYDGIDFLGVVCTYFRMTSLVNNLKSPERVVIFTPWGLLWSPFEYGATPMAGIDWNETVTKSTSGTVSNATGSFAYQVRFLGSLPIIFAVLDKGDFPQSSGSLMGSEQFFPQREPVGPPPPPETIEEPKPSPLSGAEFLPPRPGEEASNQAGASSGARDIDAGSSESMLLQQGGAQPQGRVRERDLEGENTDYQPPRRPRPQQRQQRPRPPIIIPDMPEEDVTPPPQIVRPSPFGPRAQQPAAAEGESPVAEETTAPETPEISAPETPASEPASESSSEAAEPTTPRAPAMLPGGRPSPFGPRPAPAPEASEPAPAETAPAAPAESAPAAESPAPAAEAAPAAESPAPAAPVRPSPFGPRPANQGASDAGEASE